MEKPNTIATIAILSTKLDNVDDKLKSHIDDFKNKFTVLHQIYETLMEVKLAQRTYQSTVEQLVKREEFHLVKEELTRLQDKTTIIWRSTIAIILTILTATIGSIVSILSKSIIK